jgi:hypothetical protein
MKICDISDARVCIAASAYLWPSSSSISYRSFRSRSRFSSSTRRASSRALRSAIRFASASLDYVHREIEIEIWGNLR